MKKRVVVGLSGGVDSSVAAHLLIEQGYEVIGIFMKNWHDTSVTISDDCPWVEDSADALQVAEKLGIPFQTIDLSAQYKERIVDYMFAEYKAGRTPNPDVLCNREIKFDIFLDAAMQLNADFVATGHYCRKETTEIKGKEVHHLKAGLDPNKDQSYFLCQLSQEQLGKALFPIGELAKPEVRKIAQELDLVTADKKDSQGLCFIGKVRLPDFLQQQLKAKKGKVVEIPRDVELSQDPKLLSSNAIHKHTAPYLLQVEMGEVIGEHNGAHYYTIGQRKGLAIGGKPLPLFILGTDTENNTIYVGQGEDHPALWRKGLNVTPEDEHWLRTDIELEEGDSFDFDVRIRYRQPLQKAQLTRSKGTLHILFEKPQKGIAAGQFAAWYRNDELFGSGVIH